MYYLHEWRCARCHRIMAERVYAPDTVRTEFTCWSCGLVNDLATAISIEKGDAIYAGETTAPTPIEETGGFAVVGAPELVEAIEMTVHPKKRGKAQEAVGSDGGFIVKG